MTVLLVAIKIVVRRARYKARPMEKSTMLDIHVEIRYVFYLGMLISLGIRWNYMVSYDSSFASLELAGKTNSGAVISGGRKRGRSGKFMITTLNHAAAMEPCHS